MNTLLKIIMIIIFLAIIAFATHYSFQQMDNFIFVLSILSGLSLLIGILLSILHTVNKSLFLWLIGKYERYNTLISRAKGFTKRIIRLSVFLIPMRNQKDKAGLREDIYTIAEIQMMREVNSFSYQVISTCYFISFALLGTITLLNQNEKIDIQNEKIQVQISLQEAERRSSLVFLFSNIMDAIDTAVLGLKIFIYAGVSY
jgi:hypothetical protein